MADTHILFEVLGYVVAYLLYRRARRQDGDVISSAHRRWVTAAALLGSLLGARLLHLFEDPLQSALSWTDLMFVTGGKTIVGGLIGGTVAVELTKKWLGVTVATGDVLAVPICIGTAIGRVGCFLAGLPDGTHGIATSLPWGVDFGDGISRHPTQLYESVFLLLVAGLIVVRRRQLSATTGDAFKVFMVAYLAFRFVIEFIKPVAHVGGLGAIQWASLAMLAYYTPHMGRLTREVRGV